MSIDTFLEHFEQLFNYQLFSVNQTPVTLSSLLVFFLIMGSLFMVAGALQKLMTNRLFRRIHIPTGTQYLLIRLSQYSLVIIGSIMAFQFIGIDLSGLAVIFGFLSVGIGFGLQNLTSNFIAGVILLFEQHIKVGDRVTVGGTEGDVAEINIRSTTIRSLNNVAIVVPNSEFVSATVINWSHGDPRTRLDIDIGVSYNSDLETVIRCLTEAAMEHAEVLKHPAPEVLHQGFGDSAWKMRLRAWVDTPQGRVRIQSDIHCAIVKKFREHGVEIPFPQRDLHLRSPQPLSVATTAS
jgi:small-conductance mechanosensitive channel